MRSEILYPLFAPATALPGVGPKTCQHLERLGCGRIIDILWHLPNGIIDRRNNPSVAEARPQDIATLVVTVERHLPSGSRGKPYRIECSDRTGALTLIYFNGHEDYLRAMFPEGEVRVVCGSVQMYRDQKQITHPDRVGTLQELEQIRSVEALYGLTDGLTTRSLSRIIREALSRVPDLPEWLGSPRLEEFGWVGWRESLMQAHNPSEAADTLSRAKARTRLAYDELLARELTVVALRNRNRHRPGRAVRGTGELRHAFLAGVPFSLTSSQQKASEEISADMATSQRMLRLLQGDVGSGKTVVGLLALLAVVEDGMQTAFMAPTELLARQHFRTVQGLLEPLGVRSALFTGGDKGERRDRQLEELAAGDIDVAVGTHAIFQSNVAFRDLGLCIIDEQHRFGVHQRLALSDKGMASDVLVMTATPIPRTLMMALYGDMNISCLTERPPGRIPVETRAVPLTRMEEVVERLVTATQRGARAYWLCPMVDESGASDITAATQRYAALSDRLGRRVGLLHGRLSGSAKDGAITRFANGDIDVLVATTVVEVGVDIPAASIMVIEHAERFGLAQLHQLRGRVGRGEEPSCCLLLYAPPLNETARQRLQALRNIDDGFVIAEEDLRLRGSGERLGTLQSGWPRFRLADMTDHSDLASRAREDAELILADDPGLERKSNAALRLLLGLFERDAEMAALFPT